MVFDGGFTASCFLTACISADYRNTKIFGAVTC